MGNALSVENREDTGKGVARKLRAAGRIPAVFYGHGKDPVALSLDPKPLEKLLSSEGLNALIDLEGGSVGGRTVLVKEVQRHPVRGTALHADLYEIDRTEKITVDVAVHVIGTPEGVRLEGGLLDHVLREIEVECLPGAIPDQIDVDVSALQLGNSIHVSDLQLPEGVELKTSEELSVVSVIAPAAAEEEAVAVPEGEEGAEAAAADAPEGAAEAAGGDGAEKSGD